MQGFCQLIWNQLAYFLATFSSMYQTLAEKWLKIHQTYFIFANSLTCKVWSIKKWNLSWLSAARGKFTDSCHFTWSVSLELKSCRNHLSACVRIFGFWELKRCLLPVVSQRQEKFSDSPITFTPVVTARSVISLPLSVSVRVVVRCCLLVGLGYKVVK